MRWRAPVARHLRLMKGREVKGFDAPVLIVGGGPVGLTLAIDLAVRGQRCILVEQRTRNHSAPEGDIAWRAVNGIFSALGARR
ncbi:MAG: FAD-dependent monooxygenase [Terricaulis sp.]|nr:FAD-dependent monooxygenase [Terricaulis sp.]